MNQQQHCPVGKTLSLISGKWKPVILFLIQHNVNRFNLLEKAIGGISKKVLTAQLRSLEKYGLIMRDVQKARHPQVVVYDLTGSGHSLLELLDRIFDWGADNLLEEPMRSNAKMAKKQHIVLQ